MTRTDPEPIASLGMCPMTQQHITPEQDQRLRLFNTLLTTPHRKLEHVWPVHQEIVRQDPRFYVRLAAWYNDHGDVRDHKEMFVVTLVTSDFEGHRDVGPGAAARAAAVPGRSRARLHPRPQAHATWCRWTPAATRVSGERHKGAKADDATAPKKLRQQTEEFGLFRNVPRSLQTEIERYLREREADAGLVRQHGAGRPQGAQAAVRAAARQARRAGAADPLRRGPAGGQPAVRPAQLAKATSPAEQARAIVEHAIPYRVASTVVKQMTPTVLLALVERMSPQELINNLGSLKRRGASTTPTSRR